jgi:hypothetical protein
MSTPETLLKRATLGDTEGMLVSAENFARRHANACERVARRWAIR